MSGAAESLQGGAQGMDVLAFLEAAGPHVQLHMDKLATDPSRKLEFDLLNAQFQQMMQQLQLVITEAQARSENAKAAKDEAAAAESEVDSAVKVAQFITQPVMPETQVRVS